MSICKDCKHWEIERDVLNRDVINWEGCTLRGVCINQSAFMPKPILGIQINCPNESVKPRSICHNSNF